MGTKLWVSHLDKKPERQEKKKKQNLLEQTFMFVCVEGIFKLKAKQRVTKKLCGSSKIVPWRVIVLRESLGIYSIFCDEARGKLTKWIMRFWKVSKKNLWVQSKETKELSLKKKKKNRQGGVVSVFQILDREFWKIDAITQRTLNQRNFIT